MGAPAPLHRLRSPNDSGAGAKPNVCPSVSRVEVIDWINRHGGRRLVGAVAFLETKPEALGAGLDWTFTVAVAALRSSHSDTLTSKTPCAAKYEANMAARLEVVVLICFLSFARAVSGNSSRLDANCRICFAEFRASTVLDQPDERSG